MRWLFHDPDDRVEAAARNKILARIDRWWDEFKSRSRDLSDQFRGKKKWDLPGWMHQTLQRIDSNLCWEFGPAVLTEGHRLVITPESRKNLRPLIRTILDRAPDLPGWEFYPYRLAEEVEQAACAVQGRTGGSLEGVTAELQIGEENRIDLMFRVPGASGEDDQQALNVAFVATESLLGEQALDKWAGVIEAAPPVRGGKSRAIPLARLKETFDALVESIRDRLPDRPFMDQGEGEWTLLELKPEEANDYARRADLLIAGTRDLELFKAAHGTAPFYSERFSRCKETFAYIKIDGSEGLEGSKFADRKEIEKAIDEALARDHLGVHVGVGTGLMYSYIDLALIDLRRGVQTARRTLQKGRVPKRAWILFFDADLADEWVGVYPETPPPPVESNGD